MENIELKNGEYLVIINKDKQFYFRDKHGIARFTNRISVALKWSSVDELIKSDDFIHVYEDGLFFNDNADENLSITKITYMIEDDDFNEKLLRNVLIPQYKIHKSQQNDNCVFSLFDLIEYNELDKKILDEHGFFIKGSSKNDESRWGYLKQKARKNGFDISNIRNLFKALNDD